MSLGVETNVNKVSYDQLLVDAHFTYRRVGVRAGNFSDIVSGMSAVISFVLLKSVLEKSTVISRTQTYVLNSKTGGLRRFWVLSCTMSSVEIRIVCHGHERIQGRTADNRV